MSSAIVIRQAGGPEVLKWEPVEAGSPAPGQVLLRQHAVCVNYIPEAMSFEQGAALMSQGMTAQVLLRQVYPPSNPGRPSWFTLPHIGTRAELEACASDLFNEVGNGRLRVNVNQRFALRDAAQAQRALESRATTGATVLVP